DDLFLYINYEGDVGRATIDGKLISDNFYNGTRWEIGLKRFAPEVLGNSINLQVTPLYKDAKIYLEKWPEFKDEKVADIIKIEARPEYRVSVTVDR
ncbi:MAG: glycosyl hydrolase family 35, partial [Bacteroidales bacterium]|nr:glycosyl hydrolase family 35 [Bacteroidales bacterium]